jgi:hypothetical protein
MLGLCAGQFADRVAEWITDDAFLLAAVRGAVLESIGGTFGRADVRHSYQLDWPRLAELLGADALADRGSELRASASNCVISRWLASSGCRRGKDVAYALRGRDCLSACCVGKPGPSDRVPSHALRRRQPRGALTQGINGSRRRDPERPLLKAQRVIQGVVGRGLPPGAGYIKVAASSAAVTASNSASAAVRSSTISRAMMSGAGRLSASSRDSSRSQVRSRLTLSRATSSS